MSVLEGEPPVRLAIGTAEAVLLPGLGAAVASLTIDGQELLVPRTDDMPGPLGAGSFALVPYANRIKGGDFRFGGRTRELRLNHHPETNALHGVGWQSIWTVTEEEDAAATLVHRHAADGDWPFDYEAEQRFALDDDGLSITLAVTNTGEEAMPIGLGFHPYLPAPEGAILTAEVRDVWLSDRNLIPERKAPAADLADLTPGRDVADLPFIDNCFAGWRGEAQLSAPGLPTIRVTASEPATFLHVYAPGEAFVCVEPVTAMPDAVNRPEPATETGLRTLAPGESLELSMRIERLLEA